VGVHRLDKFTTNSLFNKLVRLEIGDDHMDARLHTILLGIQGWLALLHNVDVNALRHSEILCNFIHVCFSERLDLVLGMLMCCNFTVLNEVKVNAERTNVGTLLRQILLLLVEDTFRLKRVECVQIILGNELLTPGEGCVGPNIRRLARLKEIT